MDSIGHIEDTNQEPTYDKSNRYILIGVERSIVKTDTTAKKVYNPDSHRKVYPKKLMHDDKHDVVRIAVVNGKIGKRVNTFEIRLEEIKNEENFEAKYGSPLEYIGSTKEYGTINDNHLYFHPMVVVNRIEDIGVQCIDIKGNIVNLKKETAYEYSRANGIVNMMFKRQKEQDGTTSISMTVRGGYRIPRIESKGIHWSDNRPESKYNPIFLVDIFDIDENNRRPMNSRQRLEHYMQKLEVMDNNRFDIDIDTLTLHRFKISEYEAVSKVEVPPVRRIEAGAFAYIEVDEVIIPDSVKIIDHMAFDHAIIKKLVIGDGVGFIGGDLGLRWDKLKYLELGKRVHGLERWISISPNEALESIHVSPKNPYYTSISGVLYDKAVTRLIHYPKHRRNSDYDMPNTVTSMMSLSHREAGALAYLHNLKTIRLSDGLTELPAGTFYECKKLTKVDLGNGIIEVDEPDVFTGCEALEQVKGGIKLEAFDYKALGESILATKDVKLTGSEMQRTMIFELKPKAEQEMKQHET